MSEEILIRQGAPTLAGIKTGSLFPCPCDDREALLTDVRRLNRQLVPKGLCLLPIRFKDGQALLYLYRPAVLHRDLPVSYTHLSVGVLEIMWVWNDFLLPYLVLDRTKYMTIPIVIQHLKGSYGQVDMGATMALILLSILPVIVFYLCCQKHIIKGVAAGAVKG